MYHAASTNYKLASNMHDPHRNKIFISHSPTDATPQFAQRLTWSRDVILNLSIDLLDFY